MLNGVIGNLVHALFNVLSELLEVYIEVSLDWGQLVNDYLFDEFSFESVKFLGWIHVIDGVNLFVDPI